MTIKEKRDILNNYCGKMNCSKCRLNRGDWGEAQINLDNIKCLSFGKATEAELDRAIAIISSKESTPSGNVDHPQHYQGKNECIDVMIAMFGVEAVKHFCMCNAYKYRFRAAAKNGAEDIFKAEWYESKLIELNKL